MAGLGRGGVLAGCLALLGAGCGELPDPAWLLDERPTMVTVRVEVAQAGPFGALVGPTPADRVRTEALPGDTLRFVPLVLDNERVWDPAELDVAYFACFTVECLDALRHPDALLGCRDEIDPRVRICSAGRGPDVAAVLPTTPLTTVIASIRVLAIAGVPGGLGTDECIDRARATPLVDLSECMLLERRVATGPSWIAAVVLEAAMSGEPLPTVGDPTTLDPETPPEVLAQWPNFNPEVERFSVTIERGSKRLQIDAVPGDRIAVREGDDITLVTVTDPRDAQSYAFGYDTTGAVSRDRELVYHEWYASRHLSSFAGELDSRTWTVAKEDEATRIDVVVHDTLAGVGWGSLYFEVDGDTSDQ